MRPNRNEYWVTPCGKTHSLRDPTPRKRPLQKGYTSAKVSQCGECSAETTPAKIPPEGVPLGKSACVQEVRCRKVSAESEVQKVKCKKVSARSEVQSEVQKM